MKRHLFIFVLLLLVIPSIAQNTLTIHQKDGQQFSYGFDEKPVITFSDNTLVINSTKVEVQYELSNLSKFTFDEKETGVEAVKTGASQTNFSLDEYTVCISGATPGALVSVIDSAGKTLNTYKVSSDGSITFSITELPQGLYIINSENLTYKILKK